MDTAARTQNAGFSLLELIVVLAVLAAVAALALPRARSALQNASLESTAVHLASALRLTRAGVIRSSQDKTLTFNPEQRVYWSDVEPRRRPVEGGITLTTINDAFERVGSNRRIRFRPDGSATGGVIVLSDGSRQVRVTVDWLTGKTSIIKAGR